MANKHPILNICGYEEFYDDSDIRHHVDDHIVKIVASFSNSVWVNIALPVLDQLEVVGLAREYLNDPYQSP